MAEYKGSIELISGITQKGGGSFPLASAKDIQVDDDGKRLDEKLSEIDQKINKNSGTGTSGTIPTFDLASLGLPTVQTNGIVSSLDTDTAGIKTALDNGAVKFALNIDGFGRVEIVMTKYSVDKYGVYMCVYTTPDGSVILTIADGGLQVALVQTATGGASASLPVYDLTEMGFPSLVVGASMSFVESDTTTFLADLTNGAVIIKSSIDLGDGSPMPTFKVCYATVSDGIALITNVDYMLDDALFTMIMVRPDGIAAKVSALSQTIGNQIDTYIEEALGGDY